jgi:hypothetical protein
MSALLAVRRVRGVFRYRFRNGRKRAFDFLRNCHEIVARVDPAYIAAGSAGVS